MNNPNDLNRNDLDQVASFDWGDHGETTRIFFALLPRLESFSLATAPDFLVAKIGLPIQRVLQALSTLLQRGVLETNDHGRLALARVPSRNHHL